VIGSLHARHRAIEFKKFLQRLDRKVPDELEVHLILDNASTHKTPAIKKWLATHPRFLLHFTPTSSTWLNPSNAGFAESGPAFLAQVRTIVDEGRLDETFVDAVCDPPEVFTYGGMSAHVLTFAAHRPTLVCGALIDAGVTDLGAGDPMRWVAEHG